MYSSVGNFKTHDKKLNEGLDSPIWQNETDKDYPTLIKEEKEKKMTAQEFWEKFKDIFKDGTETRKNAIENWYSNKDYTYFILSEIEKFLKTDKTINTSKEYYRIDLTAWTQLKGNRYKLFENKNFDDKAFENYLWDLEVAVEHENSSVSWMDEVVKLLHINCPLRVVIGYLPIDKKGDHQIYLKAITEQISSTKAVNNCSLKNGEFMIIIGNSKCKDNEKDFCHYKAYVFNTINKEFNLLGEI